MAKVVIEVPNGEYCGTCRFLQRGTILCVLFDDVCEEDYNNQRMIKTRRCPKEDEEHD